MRLSKLTVEQVDEYTHQAAVSGRLVGDGEDKRGLSAATIRQHIAVLSAALSYAMKHGKLASNPTATAWMPTVEDADLRILNDNEARQLLDALEVYRQSKRAGREAPFCRAAFSTCQHSWD